VCRHVNLHVHSLPLGLLGRCFQATVTLFLTQLMTSSCDISGLVSLFISLHATENFLLSAISVNEVFCVYISCPSWARILSKLQSWYRLQVQKVTLNCIQSNIQPASRTQPNQPCVMILYNWTSKFYVFCLCLHRDIKLMTTPTTHQEWSPPTLEEEHLAPEWNHMVRD